MKEQEKEVKKETKEQLLLKLREQRDLDKTECMNQINEILEKYSFNLSSEVIFSTVNGTSQYIFLSEKK